LLLLLPRTTRALPAMLTDFCPRVQVLITRMRPSGVGV
jgi:hypothetical protein